MNVPRDTWVEIPTRDGGTKNAVEIVTTSPGCRKSNGDSTDTNRPVRAVSSLKRNSAKRTRRP